RSPVYFAAGVLRANYLRFLITDIICALMVVSLFFGLTYFYGKQIWAGIHDVEILVTIAVVLAIIFGLIFFWIHRRGKSLIEQECDKESTDSSASPIQGSENSDGSSHESKSEVSSEK